MRLLAYESLRPVKNWLKNLILMQNSGGARRLISVVPRYQRFDNANIIIYLKPSLRSTDFVATPDFARDKRAPKKQYRVREQP